MTKKIFLKHFLAFALLVFLLACNNVLPKNEKLERKESPSYGTINISVDESFKPVIEEQLKVYKSSFPETNIIATYKSEVECFKDLQNDSTSLIITARELNKGELKFYKEKLFFIRNFISLF
jgi:phosphate transport system substrate-binding protein